MRTQPVPARIVLVLAAAFATLGRASAQGDRPAPNGIRFIVRVENVSTRSTLKLPDGRAVAVPLSAGVWVLHTGVNPLFIPGDVEPGIGLKVLAEAGRAKELDRNLAGRVGVRAHGTFQPPPMGFRTPMLNPGKSLEFSLTASPGDRISFVMMLGQSNDGLIATEAAGIPLFDSSGRPLSGDITGRLSLWDAGTETNEVPGLGPNQGIRQGAPHAGDPERLPVRPMTDAEYGSHWPPILQLVRVSVTPEPGK
jgi:hypothetical protein